MTNPSLISLLRGQRSRTVGRIEVRDLLDGTETFPLVLAKTGYGMISAFARVNGKRIALSGGFPEHHGTWNGLVEYLTEDDEAGATTIILED